LIAKDIISPLRVEDYEAAAVFLERITNEVFKREFWLDRFEYWWDKNPAMSEGIDRGWILRCKDGGVGGFVGNIPVKYYIKGQERTACCITSWYVGEEYRKRSIELLIPFIKQKVPALLLDTTPTEKVVKILLQLGFRSLEKKWLKRDVFYPTDMAEFWNFLAGRFGSNRVITIFFKLAGLFVIPAVKLYQIVCKFRLPAIKKKYTFTEIKRFDKSYALLWDKLKEKYDMLAVRNETTLNWFFFGSTDMLSSRKVIELRCDNMLIGYVAVKEIKHSLCGKIYYFLEVVDMVILTENASGYNIAVKGLIWLAKKNKNKVMLIKFNAFDDKIKRTLLHFGFFWKTGESRFLYKHTEGHGLDAADCPSGCFYATPLDGDRCFFP